VSKDNHQKVFRLVNLGKYQIIGIFMTLVLVGGMLVYSVDTANGQRASLYWGSSGSDVRLVQSKLSN